MSNNKKMACGSIGIGVGLALMSWATRYMPVEPNEVAASFFVVLAVIIFSLSFLTLYRVQG